MNHKYHRGLQKNILDKLLDILKNNSKTLGVVATGSTSLGDNDAFSDIDIDCYLNAVDKTGAKKIIEKVSEISPILSKLWVYNKFALFLFENGVRLDLNFYTKSEVGEQNIGGGKVIYDPKGILATAMLKGPKIFNHPKWNSEEFEYIEWLLWMFRQVYAWTKRSELGGQKSFNKLFSAIISLSQIRDSLAGIRLWINGTWDYLPNVDRKLSERLSLTYPHFEAREVLNCTRILFEEFEKLMPSYCKKRKVEVPKGKIKRLRELMDELDSVKQDD